MRLSDLQDLPPTLSTAKLAEVTGVGERTWWQVARGEVDPPFEVTPIRVGVRGRLLWPTAVVLRALGLTEP
jgi:hypothetical protein